MTQDRLFPVTVEVDEAAWKQLQGQAHGAGVSPTDIVRAMLNGWTKLHNESLCSTLARQRNKALDDLAQVEAGRAVMAVQLQDAAERAGHLEERWHSLFDAIAHGDEAHRAWLRQALDDHLAGRPVDRPPLP